MADDIDTGSGLHAIVDRVLRCLEFVAMGIATVFLLITMVLMSLDALLRYALNRPISFQLTLTEDIFLVGIICMALAWGFRTGGYIRIVGVAALLPPRQREWLLRIGLLASGAYVAVLCWESWKQFLPDLMSGAVKFGVIDYPVWLSHVWVPVGLGLLAARVLLLALGPAGNLSPEHNPAEV